MVYNFKGWKPQLISNDEYDLTSLDYSNMHISPKYDGVRMELTSDGLYGRSLKRIPNDALQAHFQAITDTLPPGLILEGELIKVDSRGRMAPCREIGGFCNRKGLESKSGKKHTLDGYKIMIFDLYSLNPDNEKMTKMERLTWADVIINKINSPLLQIVESTRVSSKEDAQEYYDMFIQEGLEGAVLSDYTKPYKKGRCTIKQGVTYKMKPHKEEDLLILDVTERMENTNESQINELGRSYKRNTIQDKRHTGIASAFVCRYNDITTKVTLTGDEDSRREIWRNKSEYIGQYAVVKSMNYGTKDKLRHAILLEVKTK